MLISQRNPLSKLENEALYERLKRAQRCRLEDQRGTEINTELPDFLKLPSGGGSHGAGLDSGGRQSNELPIDGRASEPILGCRPRFVYQESYEIPLDGRASEPLFFSSRREVLSEPHGGNGSFLSGLSAAFSGSCASPDFAAIAAQILDKSFSADGLLPSHEQADKLFGAPGRGPSPAGTSSQAAAPPPPAKSTVAASKQSVATVAARIAAIEQSDRQLRSSNPNRPIQPAKSNSNWDDLLLDLDVDWRCYQGRSETDDQKQQLQQHGRPKVSATATPSASSSSSSMSNRPPLPIPPQQQQQQLEMLDLDDPLVAVGNSNPGAAPPPPLPPKPGKGGVKLSGDAMPFKVPQQPMPPPRPPSRNVNHNSTGSSTSSRVNVSFV